MHSIVSVFINNCMKYLNKMYAKTNTAEPAAEKNPNRVIGGLKGAGVNSFTMLDEQGSEKHIPTHAYVKALEEKFARLERQLQEQDKKIRRLTNDQKLDRAAFAKSKKE